MKKAASRFAGAERGATAVEFGLVAMPLMLAIFGLIELGLILMVSLVLENATENASREIRTGQFQQSGAITAADFSNLVCSKMGWLQSTCSTNLMVESETFNNFAGLATPPPAPTTLDPAAPDYRTPCWSPGAPGDIVLVRAYYQWKLFTPILNEALVNADGGTHLITAATAFRNEPWDDSAKVGAKC